MKELELVYKAQPYVPLLLRPLISFIGVPWGKRDLQRYFREFEIMLAAQPEKG